MLVIVCVTFCRYYPRQKNDSSFSNGVKFKESIYGQRSVLRAAKRGIEIAMRDAPRNRSQHIRLQLIQSWGVLFSVLPASIIMRGKRGGENSILNFFEHNQIQCCGCCQYSHWKNQPKIPPEIYVISRI